MISYNTAMLKLVKNQLEYYQNQRYEHPEIDNFPQLEVIFEVLAQHQDSLQFQVDQIIEQSSAPTTGTVTTQQELYTAPQPIVLTGNQRGNLRLLVQEAISDYFKLAPIGPTTMGLQQLVSTILHRISTLPTEDTPTTDEASMTTDNGVAPSQDGSHKECDHKWWPLNQIDSPTWGVDAKGPLVEVCHNDCGAIRQNVTGANVIMVPVNTK